MIFLNHGDNFFSNSRKTLINQLVTGDKRQGKKTDLTINSYD
jgi:hypothetical protein